MVYYASRFEFEASQIEMSKGHGSHADKTRLPEKDFVHQGCEMRLASNTSQHQYALSPLRDEMKSIGGKISVLSPVL